MPHGEPAGFPGAQLSPQYPLRSSDLFFFLSNTPDTHLSCVFMACVHPPECQPVGQGLLSICLLSRLRPRQCPAHSGHSINIY